MLDKHCHSDHLSLIYDGCTVTINSPTPLHGCLSALRFCSLHIGCQGSKELRAPDKDWLGPMQGLGSSLRLKKIDLRLAQ